MAYVKKESKSLIGKKVILTEEKRCMSGHFEIGSIVTITEEDKEYPSRGYTFEDEFGNKIIECGYSGFKLLETEENK